MADHVRKQLRDAMKARITGLTTTGARVSGRRVYPLQAETELPALHLYTQEESAESDTIHQPDLLDRGIDFHVEGLAAAVDETIEDTLDTIAKEVETALSTAVTVDGKLVRLYYGGCTFDFEDGARRAGVIDMTFRARLFNAANTPDVLS